MARENTARGAKTRRRAEEDGGTPLLSAGDPRSGGDSGKGSPKEEGIDEVESTAKRQRLKVGSLLIRLTSFLILSLSITRSALQPTGWPICLRANLY